MPFPLIKYKYVTKGRKLTAEMGVTSWTVWCFSEQLSEHQKGREQADLNTVRETVLLATPSSFKKQAHPDARER